VTSYTLRKGSPATTRADVVVVGVVRTPKGLQAAPGGEAVAAAYGRKFAPLLSTIGFGGGVDEVAKVPTGGTIRSSLLVLVGMGDADTPDAAACRRASGVAARNVSNAASVALALPALDAEQVRGVVEGSMLGGYVFSRYRSAAAKDGPGEVVVLTDIARTRAAQDALEVARVVSEATVLARDWVNTPAGDLTPAVFAEAVQAQRARRSSKVKVSVTDDAALRSGGYGGIVGVGQASANPPRLVRLSYAPRSATTHLALVGKGITFDSGGLSIKTSSGMTTMKCDMAGAAAVVAATFAIAELGLPVRVTAFAAMAENMVSGNATRPGDVLTMYGGRTVEVLNTDAEGRLVLADGLALATEAKPDHIVDVATLTGACVVALGERTSGILGNDDAFNETVLAASNSAGESMWPLPITEEMKAIVNSSSVADLRQHNPKPYGGTLFAAAFLREFVKDVPWAHLDIAGPSFNDGSAYDYTPVGGTGVGVRTLVKLATELAGRG
jgi:leucyl aminopeptidase